MKNKKKSRQLTKKILLAFFTFVIIFAVAEVACILFYDESENYDEDVWENMLYRTSPSKEFSEVKYIEPSSGLVYRTDTKKLDKNIYLTFDYGNVTEEKTEGTYRIAVIGDSFSYYGAGLTVEEYEAGYSYDMQLEKLLNNESYSGEIENFEVLTFARGGVNTMQELIFLEELALDYNPDMVILQYCDNDIVGPMSELGFNTEGFRIMSRTRLLHMRDRIVPAFPFLDENVNWLLLRNSAFLRFVSYKINIVLANIDADVDSSFNSIREMNKITEENNIDFIIMNFSPTGGQGDSCSEENEQSVGAGIDLHAELRNLTNELDVPFYNMCDYVDDIKSIASENPVDDTHYNVEGYSIAANVLKDAVFSVLNKTR